MKLSLLILIYLSADSSPSYLSINLGATFKPNSKCWRISSKERRAGEVEPPSEGVQAGISVTVDVPSTEVRNGLVLDIQCC